MAITIALAGNPNCGKTTIFNALTGSSQHVGNWSGVTVEKKEGHLKGYKDVVITDLPGIYSLSPYTLEEVVARNYLIDEKPNVVINIIDASNIQRNLYLTTQLLELGVPMIVALNMIDLVEANGDEIDVKGLSNKLGCPVIPTAAVQHQRHESKSINNGHKHEHYRHGHTIHSSLISSMRGLDALASTAVAFAEKKNFPDLSLPFSSNIEKVLNDIQNLLLDNGIDAQYKLRWLAIKLFEGDEKILETIELSKSTADKITIIRETYEKRADDDAENIITNQRYKTIQNLLNGVYRQSPRKKLSISDKIDKIVTSRLIGLPLFFGIMWLVYWIAISILGESLIGWVESALNWFSDAFEWMLISLNASNWVTSLVVDGLIGGVTGVLTFIPQLMILFFFISLLEDCGYMARIAFIMDHIFKKFGLSGKSFIAMIIGTGCSVPGIMSARTIENDKDRKLTIMLTPFIPCGAKIPIFAMFTALLFSDAAWVGPSMYLVGILMVIVSGVILKKTRMFGGEPAPFVMELPSYHIPNLRGVFSHTWEKGKSFIIKAGTVILLASSIVWFLQSFSINLQFLGDQQIDKSILAGIGKIIAPLFKPMGSGNWMAAVAAITGLIAREMVVATFSIVGATTSIVFTQVSAYAFMVFVLLAAPCVAAIAAMKHEFGSWKWTLLALAYQTGLAYLVATLVNVVGNILFKNTKAVIPVVMDSMIMEATVEGSIEGNNIVSIIFCGLLFAMFIIGIIKFIRSRDWIKSKKALE